jgi:hypothetical protein
VENYVGLFETFSDIRLGNFLEIVEKFLDWFFPKEKFPFEMIRAKFPESVANLPLEEFSQNYFLLYGDAASFPTFVRQFFTEVAPPPERFESFLGSVRDIVRESSTKLSAVLNEASEELTQVSLLAILYHRLGFEAGLGWQEVAKEGISWGSFADRAGFHCNAHPNNVVLINLVREERFCFFSSFFYEY